jgi:tetratricopeptide (TPR) repeat protein
MLLNWLDAREATEVGAALADDFVLQTASTRARAVKAGSRAPENHLESFLGKFLQAVDRKARPLQLNVFKRAKLANTFKWRLLEKGIEAQIVEELTRTLVLRLATGEGGAVRAAKSLPGSTARPNSDDARSLLTKAGDHVARSAYVEAIACFKDSLRLDPRNAVARNNLGAALCRVGDYNEAEEQFRRAIGIKEKYPDALFNLGTLLRLQGKIVESEMPLRRALKLKPAYVDAQIGLGATLTVLGRLDDAKAVIDKALKLEPRNVDALLAQGALRGRQGQFAEAEALFRRALEIDPNASDAWVGLAGVRRMSSADGAGWLKGALASANSGLEPLSEARIRFAIGKYYDDTGDFARAFGSYQQANELMKTAAVAYDRDARERFVGDLTRIYARESFSEAHKGGSDSKLPVLVVGMPRSGTSLVEQIIASHPAAKGAGEHRFWGQAFRRHASKLLQGSPDQRLRSNLAEEYLSSLAERGGDALRVVDKSTLNSDYLGIVHSVVPNARMIYVQRDPVDTCLSCYFQDFPPSLNFTLDMSDLAHYYREHHRLISHWRKALPPTSLLVVPYEQLVADQEKWTRRILDFIDLPWDARCLDYHLTESTVLTASYWQVRQTLYRSSIGRWRNYEKFIGPLLTLRNLDS